MTRDGLKKTVSFAVFGLGIAGGLWGWLAYLGAMFVVGENDCPQEIWAITFALATPLPACIVAIRWRVVAGSWLIFAGLFFPYGMLVERSYMINVRHFTDQQTPVQTIEQGLVIASPILAVGLFSLITGLLKWPKLIGEPEPLS
jgi:hypothetical protein